jgi:membrane protein insertase Oxa1/YidC/SpoIIIJ
MIFPILNGVTFFLLIEVGAEGMPQNATKDTFKMAMRAMSVVMVPMTMSMPQVRIDANKIQI